MQVTESIPGADSPDSASRVLECIVELTSTADIKVLDRLFLDCACALFPLDYLVLWVSTATGSMLRVTRYRDRKTHSYQTSWQQGALPDEQALLIEQARESVDGESVMLRRDRQLAAFSRQNELGNRVNLLVQYPPSVTDEQMTAFHALKRIYLNFRCFLDASQRDPLTGLLNRRYFDDCIHRALEAIGEEKHSSAVDVFRRSTDGARQSRHWLAILDIDHFKKFNDAYGHLYGDEILLLFSRVMEKTFRESDLLFRFGGEEFVVIMENSNPQEALSALERFRHAVQVYPFPQGERVTVSCGAIEAHGNGSATALLGKADEALYYAKNHGRNRTVMYEQLISSGEVSDAVATVGGIELF